MRHSAWMSSVSYYVGLIAVAWALYQEAYVYLGYALLIYFLATLTISVGYHRLFCHSAFVTSRFWHWAFALYGVLLMYSSPLQWAVTHATHHRHSDTDRDPHPLPMRPDAFLRKGYRDVPLMTIRGRKLMRDPLHRIIDGYYVLIFAVMVTALYLISPTFFLYSYLPALGIAHFVGACHNTFSHAGHKPRDLWFLEWLLPSAGEWSHAHHHKNVRSPEFGLKWWHLDTGALLIKAIKKA